ncbi:MAG: ATP-binding cassette domain-containing protein [Tepidamorphaceae bacterium]
MSGHDHMLRVEGLDAWYGRARALFGVDLALKRGEVLALIGRNGAGKSTLMKAVMGLVTAKANAVEFDGASIAGLPAHAIARAGLGYVPEERRIFTNLTVAENLSTGRQRPRDGVAEWTPERIFDLFPNLAEMQNRSAREMSGGEQQMLAVARTLMGNPGAAARRAVGRAGAGHRRCHGGGCHGAETRGTVDRAQRAEPALCGPHLRNGDRVVVGRSPIPDRSNLCSTTTICLRTNWACDSEGGGSLPSHPVCA